MSNRIAKGKMKHQRINGRMVTITLRQRQKWLLVAGQIALIIKNASFNINEEEIYAQLNKLEKLAKETVDIEKIKTE
jgi:hypothetical protein